MLVTASVSGSVGSLGGIGEVMHEVSYVCVYFPGDYVFEVGS